MSAGGEDVERETETSREKREALHEKQRAGGAARAWDRRILETVYWPMERRARRQDCRRGVSAVAVEAFVKDAPNKAAR